MKLNVTSIRQMSVLMLSVVALVTIVSVPALAASTTVAYQGVLKDTNGTAVTDGPYPMTFSLWNDATAGTKVWEESYAAITVSKGLFFVQLGSVTSLGTVFKDNSALWLQIAADTGTGLEPYPPRTPLTSVPYAKKAETATSTANATNATSATNATNATNTPNADSATNATNATNADTVDGQHAAAFSLTGHKHAGEDITSGTISTNWFSAYTDLSAEGKIGSVSGQVAAGDHTHTLANYFVGQIGGETSGTKNLYRQEGDINTTSYGGAASGGLVAPVTGLYFVHFQQLVRQPSNATYLSMRLNNNVLVHAYAPSTANHLDMIVSRLVPMNANDVISFTIDTYVQNETWGGLHSAVSMFLVK